nr:hypothetical protein [Tanacetum cinerariifolium]
MRKIAKDLHQAREMMNLCQGFTDRVSERQTPSSCVWKAASRQSLFSIPLSLFHPSFGASLEPVKLYSYDKQLALKIHHNGHFTRLPDRRYHLGEIYYVHLIDCHILSTVEFWKVDVYVKEDVLVVEQHMIEEKLSQESPRLDEIFDGFNSSLDDVIANLIQDDIDMPWVMATPDTDDDASISGLEADDVELELEDEIADADIFVDLEQAYEEEVHSHLDEANEVELELEDEIAVAEIFADLDEAYEEDVDSHLDEALALEDVRDLGMFDNSVDDDSVQEPNKVELEVEDEIGEIEVYDQLLLGDPVDNEMTKYDAIENSFSNVHIGRLRKRKRVEYDETDLGYTPTGNSLRKRKLNKDERYATDFVDDVEE